MKPKYPTNKGFTLIELLVVMTIIAVLAGVGFQAFTRAQETSRVTATLSHLKDIDTALFQYAGDNNDRLPYKDKGGNAFANSNEAFRELFKEGFLKPDAESVFEVPSSPATVDNYTGEGPEYMDALKQGECHWAMVKGGSYNSSGPLVWENSLTNGWDPSWDPTIERTQRGSCWSGARVIILTSGHAVKTYKLEKKDSASKLENLGNGNKNIFTQAGQKDSLDPLGL